MPLSTEQDQILRLLRRALLDVPTSHPNPQLQQLELEVKFAWPMLRSRARVFLRSVLWQVSMVLRNVSTATWKGMGAVNFSEAGKSLSVLCLLFLVLCSFSLFCFFELTTPRLVHLNGNQQAGYGQSTLALTDVEPSAVGTTVTASIEEQEKESSSDGSFSKISAIRVSDDSSSSEHSYLLPEESAPAGTY